MSCWQKRQQQILKAMAEDETALIKRLSSFYSVELCRLEKEIGAYYARYGEGNVIRHKTLMVQLSNEDKQLLLQRMEDFAGKYPQYGHLMPARDNVYKLNRLEGLQYSVAMQQLELGAAEHEQITAHLDRQAMRGLNASAEVLGFGENYYGDNKGIVKLLVNAAWAGQESLSERIWRGKRRLAEHLNREIAHSIIRGEGYALLTRRLRESFTNVSRNNAYRLIYTEGTFVMSESTMYPFTEDFEKYRIAPVKDGKACDVCKGIAEQVFDIADRKAGVSFPPLHPWCRCSFEIVVEDWDKWIEEYERKHGNGKGREIAERFIPLEIPYSKQGIRIYSKEEIENIAQYTHDIANKHLDIKSKWSGKIIVDDNSDRYGKLWNCDIRTTSETAPHIILHEQIHARSISYYDIDTYRKNRIIEEGAVEFVTKEICKKEFIPVLESEYDELANTLKEINTLLNIESDDYQFSKRLITIPVPERLAWLENKAYNYIKNNNMSIYDAQRINECIDKLR